MTPAQPRYVVTFRTQTPETVLAALATIAGALVAAFYGYVFFALGCVFSGKCTTGGLLQFLWAGAGVIPAVAMLVESLRKRGHPWLWFLITAFISGGWAIFMYSETP